MKSFVFVNIKCNFLPKSILTRRSEQKKFIKDGNPNYRNLMLLKDIK